MEINSEIYDRIKPIDWAVYCGVYFLFDKDDLVYVGVSSDILRRLRQHKQSKNWDNVKWIKEDDYLNAIEIEHYFINNYTPKYNKTTTMYRALLPYVDKDKSKIPYPSSWNPKKDEKYSNSNF